MAGATGKVAGPLVAMRGRVYVGGVAQNTAENVVGRIVAPQSMPPRSAMPASGVSEAEARDRAAFLYSRRSNEPVRSRALRSPFLLPALALLIGALAVTAFRTLPLRLWVGELATSLAGLGIVGVVLFAAAFTAGCLLLVPTSVMAVAAGLVFGPLGLLIAWVAMMTAAAASLVLARNLFAERLRSWMAARRSLGTVAEVVDEEGWKAVLLVRVSGIAPFGVQNYALSVTRIGLIPYMAATSVGILPSILTFAGAGAFGNALMGEGSAASLAALSVAVLAAVLLVLGTAIKVRRRILERALVADEPGRRARGPDEA